MQNWFGTVIGLMIITIAVFGVLRIVMSPRSARRPGGSDKGGWDGGISLGDDGSSTGHHGHDCGGHDGGGHDGDCGGGHGD